MHGGCSIFIGRRPDLEGNPIIVVFNCILKMITVLRAFDPMYLLEEAETAGTLAALALPMVWHQIRDSFNVDIKSRTLLYV